MNITALKKLEQIIQPDFDLVTENMIIPVGKKYSVFERYEVCPGKEQVTVNRYGNKMGVFTTTRTAISWCIADKYNQLRLADEIANLDTQRGRLRIDLDMQQHLLKKFQETSKREILRLKMETKKLLLSDIEERLNKCVGVAKYWQIRGFNNEIARTRRPASNRTNLPRDRKSLRD